MFPFPTHNPPLYLLTWAPTLQHSCPEPDEYITTMWNQPFAPGDLRTAEEINRATADTNMTDIRRTLIKNWWDVEQKTRCK